MNERGKGRDTENYDETSKIGLPFFLPFVTFSSCFFFAVHLDSSW